MKTKKLISILFACLMLVGMFVFTASATDANSEGTRTFILKMGKSYAGKSMYLEQDGLVYPGTLSFDNKGILQLSVGDSETYVLTSSDAANENQEEMLANAELPDGESLTLDKNATLPELTTGSEEQPEGKKKFDVTMILFPIGLVLCIGYLVYDKFFKNKKSKAEDDDDDE